jgi:Domain of unknown function (DUF4170)
LFRDYCHECRRRQKAASSSGVRRRDLENLDIVGIYPNYESAKTAWKAKAQQTVDNAHMRYFIVHLHRLLDPEGVTLQAD